MTSAKQRHRDPSIRGLIGWLTMLICVVGATTLGPRSARAQSGQIEELVEEATTHYDQLEIQKARQKLQRALEIADDQDLSGTEVARAHVILGVVVHGADKDREAALSQFRSALEHDPDIEVPAVYQTPALEKLMKKARESVDTSGSAEDDNRGGPRRDVDEFTHEPIASARAGEPLVVQAFVPTDVSVAMVNFYFQRYDQDSWMKASLEATNATRFATEVPGYKIYTSQIAYYLEAIDPSGNVVATSGDERDPHTITVLGSSGFDPEQAKREAMAKKRRADNQSGGESGEKRRANEETGPSGGESGETAPPVAYIELGGGSGAGFVPQFEKNDNAPPPTANPQRAMNPGLAPAFAHATLGGGAWLDDSSTIGIYLRWQLAPSTDFQQGAATLGTEAYSGVTNGPCLGTGLIGDCQLGVKYRWYFTGAPDLELFSSVGGGVGRVRHWVRLREQESSAYCENNNKTVHPGEGTQPDYCYRPDTVRPGFLHVGAGGGFTYQFSEVFYMMGEAYLEVLFPDPSINLDVQFGPQFRF